MTFLDRIASAPISWGICEVPGWGRMLPTAARAAEMSGLGDDRHRARGARASCPTDPDAVKAELARATA